MDYQNIESNNVKANENSITNQSQVRNGAVWYVAIVPILALYLEMFATNKFLGLLIWGYVIISSCLICIKDKAKLENAGYNTASMIPFLPPIYLFQRCGRRSESVLKAILCVMFTVTAFISNGFATSFNLSDDDYIEQVQYNYVANIENCPDTSTMNFIGDQLEAFANKDSVKYEVVDDDGFKNIVITGKFDDEDSKNQEFKIVFYIRNDGFAYTAFKIDKVYVDGKEIEDDDRKDFLNKIFYETGTSDESTGDSLINDSSTDS